MRAGLALAATTLAGAPDDVELIVGQSGHRKVTRKNRTE
jgi:hypothetical protein